MKTWAFCFSTAKAEAMAFRARCVLVLSKRQCGTLFQSHNATIMFLKGMMVFLVLVVGSLIAISNLESSICRTLRNGIFIKFQDLIIASWISFPRRLCGKSCNLIYKFLVCTEKTVLNFLWSFVLVLNMSQFKR